MTAGKNLKAAGLVCAVTVFGLIGCDSVSDVEKITYENEEYCLLEYNQDILYYDFYNASGQEFEVEEISMIEDSTWDMIWVEGDLYVKEADYEEAQAYYSDESNYEWYVTVEDETGDTTYPIILTDEEVTYIYDMERLEKDTAIYFEEIEVFGTLGKRSKDQMIDARTSIVRCDETWYWNTETIDENKEKDGEYPEYVQELPESLTRQILQ